MKTPSRHPKLVPSLPTLALVAAFLPAGLAACGALDESSGPAGSADVSSATSALQIGPDPSKAMDYIQCASENGTCVLGSTTKYVAYGAQGSFYYQALSGNVPCNNTTFGDPIQGPTKACYYANYAFTLNEGSSDSHIQHEIAFGANGKFYFQKVSGTWSCNTTTFGDPIQGVSKACYNALPEYVQAALENQTMTGLNKTPVAFGGHGAYAFQILTGSAGCTTTTFGDPAQGVSKTCYKFPYNWIADENGSFSVSQYYTIYYGSGLDGKFIAKTIPPQNGFSCTNSSFGADPAPGVTKHCYIAAAQ